MIFELARDFRDAVMAMPSEHPKHRVLELLEEAVRRDIHFLARHPTTLFQCMWNTCWWYDCPEAARHYDNLDTESLVAGPRENARGNLFQHMEDWRSGRTQRIAFSRWVRAVRPPSLPLGGALRAVLRGHDESVNHVSYSPDGRIIASGSADGTVRLWDAYTSVTVGILPKGGTVSFCIFSPSGSQLASAGSDGKVQIWDMPSGHLSAVFSAPWHDPVPEITGIAFSPDGKRLAASICGRTRIWNIATGEKIAEFEGLGYDKVAFSQDGSHVVCVARTLMPSTFQWQWYSSDGRPEKTFTKGISVDIGVALSRDGKNVVNWDAMSNEIRVWDTAAGEELLRMKGVDSVGPYDTYALSLSDDGRFLIWTDLAGKIQIYDIMNNRPVARLGGCVGAVGAVAISPDRVNVVSGYDDGVVRIWRIRDSADIPPVGHKRNITSVAVSPDGKSIVTGSLDGSIQFWDSSDGTRCRVLRSNQRWVRSVGYSPCGRYLISCEGAAAFSGIRQCLSNGGKRTLSISDLRFAEMFAIRDYLPGDQDVGYYNISSAKDDSVVCFDSYFGKYEVKKKQGTTLRIWNPVDGTEMMTLSGTEAVARVAAFSHDSRLIACGAGDGSLRVWTVTGSCHGLYGVGKASIESVAFSHDGALLATGGIDGIIYILDASSRKKLFSLEAGSEITSLAFSRDCTRLASTSRGNTCLWDLAKKVCVDMITGRSDAAAIASGCLFFPLWPVARNQETVIMDAATCQSAAWFQEELSEMKTHPEGHTWVGATGAHLHILKLETA